jgi:hypothetical protein
MLDWKRLMVAARFRDSGLDQEPERTPFERDLDQIIYRIAVEGSRAKRESSRCRGLMPLKRDLRTLSR